MNLKPILKFLLVDIVFLNTLYIIRYVVSKKPKKKKDYAQVEVVDTDVEINTSDTVGDVGLETDASTAKVWVTGIGWVEERGLSCHVSKTGRVIKRSTAAVGMDINGTRTISGGGKGGGKNDTVSNRVLKVTVREECTEEDIFFCAVCTEIRELVKTYRNRNADNAELVECSVEEH